MSVLDQERQQRREPKAQPTAQVEWLDPVALDETGAAPGFPLDVFPQRVIEFVSEIPKDTRAAVDYAAMAALGAASIGIGATHRGVIKGHWSEQPNLWIGLVGESSEKKSPSARWAFGPVWEEHDRRIAKLEERDDARERRNKRAKAEKREEENEPKTPFLNDEGDVLVTDSTVEGLAKLFARQHRGVLSFSDELSGWLAGMNQYKGGKGNDRQAYILMYDGKQGNRVLSKGKTRVKRCFLSIFGGIQPELLPDILGERDGLDARFLFTFPERRTASEEDFVTVNEEIADYWALIMERLFANQLVEKKRDNGDVYHAPRLLHMDADAQAEWRAYTRWGAEIQNAEDINPKLREWMGKHEGFGMRLAVVLRMLSEAAGDFRPANTITGTDVHNAATLMRYCHSMTMRVLSSSIADPRLDGARRVLAWIRRHNPVEFTRLRCWECLRSSFPEPNDLAEPLKALSDRRYLRWKDVPKEAGKPGPTTTGVWEVNPKCLEKPQ